MVAAACWTAFSGLNGVIGHLATPLRPLNAVKQAKVPQWRPLVTLLGGAYPPPGPRSSAG